MANTLTDLIPDMYEAIDVISRELTGFIPSVNRNSNAERAGLNDNVRVPITRAETSATNTPAVTPPDTGDATVDNVNIQITKSKHVPIRHNGEERRSLLNAGTFSSIFANRAHQAMRTLVNEIEVDVWTEAYQSASRGFGSAGTTPFATAADMADWAGVLRILEENGAPQNDLQIVLGHAAVQNLRGKQSGLFKVNEAGSSDMLRNGMTDRIMKMAVRHSDAVGIHTKGTSTLQDVNGGDAVGVTSITYAGGDGGTILAGDIVTVAGDTNKYVVQTAITAAGGELVIGKPGLQEAAADAAEITIGANYTANVAFDRSAVVLATRAPAMPEGGDQATDMVQIADPISGLVFEFAEYKQFLQTSIHCRIAWGQKVIKEEHVALLLG